MVLRKTLQLFLNGPYALRFFRRERHDSVGRQLEVVEEIIVEHARDAHAITLVELLEALIIEGVLGHGNGVDLDGATARLELELPAIDRGHVASDVDPRPEDDDGCARKILFVETARVEGRTEIADVDAARFDRPLLIKVVVHKTVDDDFVIIQ